MHALKNKGQPENTHLIHQSVLPDTKEHEVGFVSRSKGGEKVFLPFSPDLNSIRNDQGSLLLGHGHYVLALDGYLKIDGNIQKN